MRVPKTVSWSSLFVAVFIVVGACSSSPLQTLDVTVTTQPEVQASSPSSPSVAPETVLPPSTSVSLPAAQIQTAQPSSTGLLPAPSVVKQAMPTRVAIPNIGYSASGNKMTRDGKENINPPGYEDAYLITDVGALPGSDADNTVYIACHAWLDHDAEAPCTNVSRSAKVSDNIVVTTANGVLTYQIKDIEKYDKVGAFYNSDKVATIEPRRMVLVTCAYDASGKSTQNIVFFAVLTSWKAGG